MQKLRQNTKLNKKNPLARWIIPGRTLRIANRVLNISNCQIYFSPKKKDLLDRQGDVVETARFWYRRPVEGAILYVPDYSQPDCPLVPAKDRDISNIKPSHYLWLIEFHDAQARAIRTLLSKKPNPTTSN